MLLVIEGNAAEVISWWSARAAESLLLTPSCSISIHVLDKDRASSGVHSRIVSEDQKISRWESLAPRAIERCTERYQH